MAQSENGRRGDSSDGPGGGSVASRNPMAERLLHSAGGYLGAQSEKLAGSLGDRVSDATRRLTDVAGGGAQPTSLLGRTAKNIAQGDSPAKAGLKGIFGGITDQVKAAFGGKGKGKGPAGRKSMNIEESIDVGVPIRQAYNQWTQYTEYPKWSKGVQSVNQEDDTKSGWNAKVFWSKRNWNAKINEQIPDQRIAWTSDGHKGTVDGVVTFHELAPNLTRILLTLEYHPAGLFEKTGNLWRAQGRRARLDLKLYRRFVMMSNEEVEGWRGEIRDGEVVRDHDEVVAEEQEGAQQDEAAEDDYDAEDYDEADEYDYDDEEAEDGEDAEYEEEEAEDGEEAEDDYDEEYEEEEEEEPAPRRRAS